MKIMFKYIYMTVRLDTVCFKIVCLFLDFVEAVYDVSDICFSQWKSAACEWYVMTTKQYTQGTLNMNEMKFRPDKFPGFPSR